MEANILRTRNIQHHNTTNDIVTTYPLWLTFLRIALGLVLIGKGISFFYDSNSLETMIHTRGWQMFENNTQSIALLITYVTLLGGVFISTGFLTRWMSMIQVPLLIGAVIFNIQEGISFSNSELILSVVTLLALFVFSAKGSGPISADEFFRSYTYAGQEKGHTKKFFMNQGEK